LFLWAISALHTISCSSRSLNAKNASNLFMVASYTIGFAFLMPL